jgi:hypothetical protein
MKTAWCLVSAGCCTRCGHEGWIRTRGTLAFDVPYQLCSNCFGVYRDINRDAAYAFAQDLWRKGAALSLEPLRSLEPEGRA